jgi:hypothetical protein
MSDTGQENLRFKEIEHKFVVDDKFDLEEFGAALAVLNPTRTTSISVLDTYYLIDESGGFVIRHRYDTELHHLTLKALAADTEVRDEINIDLGHHAGNQQAQVDAFLRQIGVIWSGSLRKELTVWYFPDIEVVHYHASTETRAVQCVEFEATHKPSLAAALETVHRYEQATGFDRATRSSRSLPEILFPEIDAHLSKR